MSETRKLEVSTIPGLFIDVYVSSLVKQKDSLFPQVGLGRGEEGEDVVAEVSGEVGREETGEG